MSRRTHTYNGYESGLAGPLGIGATSVAVDSAAGLVAPLYLVIDPDVPASREWIRVNTINANTLENIVRNQEGSVGDVAHLAGAKIRAVWTKQQNDDVFQDLEDDALDLTQHETDGGDPHAAAGYLDEGATDALYVKLVGSTMTGFLTLFADPTANLHASTKQYVDVEAQAAEDAAVVTAGAYTDGEITTHAADADAHHTRYTDNEAVNAVAAADVYLQLSGGAMTGPLNMDGQSIDNVLQLNMAGDIDMNNGNIIDVTTLNIVPGGDIDMKDNASQSLRMQNVAGTGGFALSKVDATTFQIWSYTDGFACMEIDAGAKTITAVNGYSFV